MIFRLAAAPLCAAVVVLASCATTPRAAQAGPGRLYTGHGSADTPLDALGAAKMDAVDRAIEDLMGTAQAEAHADEIRAAFEGSDNPNAFVYNQTLKILSTGGDPISYTITIRVNVDAVRATLTSLGLAPQAAAEDGGTGGTRGAGVSTSASAGATGRTDAASGTVGGTANAVQSPGADSGDESTADNGIGSGRPLSAEARARIQHDLDHVTYMVTYNNSGSADSFLLDAAVSSADTYLADNGLPYIDEAQIESLKRDQQKVYEEETHQAQSLVQWIAQKLNADIYVVIDLQTSTAEKGNYFYGSAVVSLRSFESSTGAGRGSATYSSLQPSVSIISTRDALINAVQSSTYKAMGEAVAQARSYFARELQDGIAYTVLFQNTQDDKSMRSFIRDLTRRVQDIKTLSVSPEESRYSITLAGTSGDLQDIIYQTAQLTPGLRGLSLVTLRGKELTFDTGM